jgi:lipid A ethanolaminephosphotransferase
MPFSFSLRALRPNRFAARPAGRSAAPSPAPSHHWRPTIGLPALIVLAAVFFTITANPPFLMRALAGRSLQDPGAWGLGAALVVALTALHVGLLALLCTRWTAKPVLAVLAVVAAVASHYSGVFGTYLDPSMMRNLLRTHPAEAVELLSPALALQLLVQAGLPNWLLWRLRLRPQRWPRALLQRAGLLALAAVTLAVAVLAVFQPLSSLMRNQRELRYLIAPVNVLWSTGAVLVRDTRAAALPRQPIGLDAQPGPSWATRTRPLMVVMVVGETARAADWGLNPGNTTGTTPELARWQADGGLVNFPAVKTCGTDTETSLPCMFAPVGRRDYDEGRIRGQQSLLHVLSQAGVAVHWRDNQSGCKGVCEGLSNQTLAAADAPALCPEGRCLDEALLADLPQRLQQAQGTQLLVLHMLGSHGPSYYRRYPPAFAVNLPDCRHDELRRCSVEEVHNAYLNSLRYTDHVLAQALQMLKAQEDRVDTALVFVSDHGESLGEHGLFLHGMPYAIAPEGQTRVPMVAWASAGLSPAIGLQPACLQGAWQAAAQAGGVAHDHLFHTLLGLLDVRTALHAPAWDLTQACRPAAGTAPATP